MNISIFPTIDTNRLTETGSWLLLLITEKYFNWENVTKQDKKHILFKAYFDTTFEKKNYLEKKVNAIKMLTSSCFSKTFHHENSHLFLSQFTFYDI